MIRNNLVGCFLTFINNATYSIRHMFMWTRLKCYFQNTVNKWCGWIRCLFLGMLGLCYFWVTKEKKPLPSTELSAMKLEQEFHFLHHLNQNNSEIRLHLQATEKVFSFNVYLRFVICAVTQKKNRTEQLSLRNWTCYRRQWINYLNILKEGL